MLFWPISNALFCKTRVFRIQMMNGHGRNESTYITVAKVFLAEPEIDIYIILNSITAEFVDIAVDTKREKIIQFNWKRELYPKIKY